MHASNINILLQKCQDFLRVFDADNEIRMKLSVKIAIRGRNDLGNIKNNMNLRRD